jgi:hypothetical protein
VVSSTVDTTTIGSDPSGIANLPPDRGKASAESGLDPLRWHVATHPDGASHSGQ